jgi:hypothetical protein
MGTGKTALLMTLVSAVSWAQEVNVYSTTFAQYYKQDVPGLDRQAYTPLTEFLGIDATGVGVENLSLHLFGWGNFDLGEQTRLDGKTTGSLTYGYVRYRFDRANGEVQAGRFAINHGLGYEQIDGITGRVDLKGGFSISAFGGRPVLYGVQELNAPELDQKHEYEYQRGAIVGARLAYRLAKMGELGVSFVQDGSAGSTSYYDRPGVNQPYDYRRRLVGGDVYIVPMASLLFTGRMVFDMADHDINDALVDWDSASKIAEHDYSLAYRLANGFSAKVGYAERNFQAYYGGSNLPSLFSTFEKDRHQSYSGSASYADASFGELSTDYRHISRETFGDADRVGFEYRLPKIADKIGGGLGYHRVDTAKVKWVDPLRLSYSLSHHEIRAWAMCGAEKLSASLDGIAQMFDDDGNPSLNGQSSLYEVIASLGIKPTENLRVSADVAYGSTALAKSEARGTVRVEYRFGFNVGRGGK